MKYLKTTLSNAGVFTVHLNRPDKHHALNVGMLSELTQTFSAAFANEAINVIVIRASGRVFCAGADLKAMQANTKELIAHIIGMLKVLRHKNKPICVALTGDVYGGGSLLLGYADVIMAKKSVSIIMPEIKSSLWPVFLMHVLKPHLPQTTLMHMAMTAEPLSANRAHTLGWFSNVFTEDKDLHLKLESVIKDYCQHSQTSLEAFYRCYKDGFKETMTDDILDQLGKQLFDLVRIRGNSIR